VSRVNDVHAGIWGEDDFLDLTAPAKLLYLWSFTNPLCGMSGVYRVSLRVIAFETGMAPEHITAALDELRAARFIVYAQGVMFVRTRVKHLRTKSTNIAKSIAGDVRRLPADHPVRVAFMAEYADDEEWGAGGLHTQLHGASMEAPKEPQADSQEPQRGSMATAKAKAVVVDVGTTNSDGRARIDDDDWPPSLPETLTGVAEHVHGRLGELAQAKGVPPPVRRRVGAVVADFPDHDHRALVGDVVDYWRDGRGARTVRKDLAKVYRDKCSRSTPPPESPVGARG
jgi:hypothetical protein